MRAFYAQTDPSGLAKACLRLMQDDGLRARCGEEALASRKIRSFGSAKRRSTSTPSSAPWRWSWAPTGWHSSTPAGRNEISAR